MMRRRDLIRSAGGLLAAGSFGSLATTLAGCGGGGGGGGNQLPQPSVPLPNFPVYPATALPASPTRGQEFTNPKDGSVLVWIPSATFTMGRTAVEQVRYTIVPHTVTLGGYWMAK